MTPRELRLRERIDRLMDERDRLRAAVTRAVRSRTAGHVCPRCDELNSHSATHCRCGCRLTEGTVEDEQRRAGWRDAKRRRAAA